MSNQVMVLFIQIFGALSTTSKVPSWFIILEKKLTATANISQTEGLTTKPSTWINNTRGKRGKWIFDAEMNCPFKVF